MLRVPPRFLELYSGAPEHEPVDAHSIQPYYTLLLAKESGMEIGVKVEPEEIIFTAVQSAVSRIKQEFTLTLRSFFTKTC